MSVGSIHPPYVLSATRNLAEVEFHRNTVVIVNHQIIVASGSQQTVISFTVLTGDDALVRHTLKVWQREHQILEMLHLVESRVVECHIPRLLGSITSITGRIAWLQHLHDGIMTIGMTAGTGKDTPIGIAANIIILPALLVRIVQSLRNILVAWFGIEHRLDRFVCPGRIHIHPVVFLGIVRDRIILVAHTLTILAVTTLEGMEIEPFRLAPPFG